MFTKPVPNSGIPIYVQLKGQIMHAIEKGALKSGDQLPSVRVLAEKLVINPNTVIKIYRELEFEGVIEIRHGSGAFVSNGKLDKVHVDKILKANNVIEKTIQQLVDKGLSKDEIRRVIESVLQKIK
jgi:GntR family transcriptional regulator